jgi:hypothetical protein
LPWKTSTSESRWQSNANISLYGRSNILVGIHVKLGHTAPGNRIALSTGLGESTLYADFAPFNLVNIENHQKDRNQIYRHAGQVYTSKGVDTTATDPRKRTGGADIVVVADLSTGGTDWGPHFEYAQCSIFDQRIFQLGGSNKSYRIYLQSTVAIASGKILIEVEFMDSYASPILWTETRKTGTAAISARSGVTDWSQYVEVTGVNPPEDCAVRVRLFCSAYSAANYLYIDPKVGGVLMFVFGNYIGPGVESAKVAPFGNFNFYVGQAAATLTTLSQEIMWEIEREHVTTTVGVAWDVLTRLSQQTSWLDINQLSQQTDWGFKMKFQRASPGKWRTQRPAQPAGKS